MRIGRPRGVRVGGDLCERAGEYHRVQSLWAGRGPVPISESGGWSKGDSPILWRPATEIGTVPGPVLLHGPHTLPNGSAERLIFKVPPAAIQNGRLTLHFMLDQGPNAVASVIELWARLAARAAAASLECDSHGLG